MFIILMWSRKGVIDSRSLSVFADITKISINELNNNIIHHLDSLIGDAFHFWFAVSAALPRYLHVPTRLPVGLYPQATYPKRVMQTSP
jgi:hypothetical protein